MGRFGMIRVLHLLLLRSVQCHYMINCATMEQDCNHMFITYNGEPKRDAVVYCLNSRASGSVLSPSATRVNLYVSNTRCAGMMQLILSIKALTSKMNKDQNPGIN